MDRKTILRRIAGGRTDLVFDLLAKPNWKDDLISGDVRVLQWFVYFGDVTALKAVLAAGGDLENIDLDRELGHAAFFGHWKVVDFLIKHGADVNFALPDSGETALHSALCKAGKPYYLYTIRLLVENGADVNARTKPGAETGAYMRDVRTKGETPLHRAAAYGSFEKIKYLIDHGANCSARDANGDSPLTWASEHLRPGRILRLLAFDPFFVSEKTAEAITADHGSGWGDGMDRKFMGDFLTESLDS